MNKPTDRNGGSRESGEAWLDDFDEPSELLEFRGAASALEEFRDSSVPLEQQAESDARPDEAADELTSFDSALDEAFVEAVVDHHNAVTPIPSHDTIPSTSPIPTMSPGASPIPMMSPGASPVPSMIPYGTPTPTAPGFEHPTGVARRGWVIPAIVIAAIVGISAVTVTIIVTRQTDDPVDNEDQPSQFILIKGEVVPEGDTVTTRDAEARPNNAQKARVVPIEPIEAGPTPEGDVGPQKNVRERQTPPAPEGTDVSKAFAGQRDSIAKCFENHARGAPNVPAIDIDFALSDDGSVEQVLLQPVAIRGTPLGSCLQGVAQSTRFPAPGKAVEFRIPITARRVE